MTGSRATVRRRFDVGPERVWEALSDGWLYPSWVVGAARMRDVDGHWPAVGSRLHHSFGNWPALIDDRTEVLEAEPPRLLRLRAHGWPAGAAEVVVRIEASGSGSMVEIEEDAVRGPGTLVPMPVRQLMMVPRNKESLRRLAFIAERRWGEGPEDGSEEGPEDGPGSDPGVGERG
ncbi:MAG: SRPBCC domain-containing protein [Marmoricola sp.]